LLTIYNWQIRTDEIYNSTANTLYYTEISLALAPKKGMRSEDNSSQLILASIALQKYIIGSRILSF